VVAPAAVTWASVEVVDPAGQSVPFSRHTDCPFTAMEEALMTEPEALVNERFVANALVLVLLVEVTFVSVTFPSVAWPETDRVPVAVRFDAVSPPNAEMRILVDAPFAVIIWSVAVVAAAPGQFVPFCKHTLWPEIKSDEPEAAVNARSVEVV